MKREFKFALLFIIPVLIMASTTIGYSYWKNSIKDESGVVNQNLYTVNLIDPQNSINNATYGDLEYDSAFELPKVASNVVWTCNGTTYNPGYYKYSTIAASASITSLTFTASY